VEPVFLDGISYSGKRRAFDFRSSLEVVLGVGIELLRIDQPVAKELPKLGRRKPGRLKAVREIPGEELCVHIPTK
jgi:hypothetical protein